MYNFWQHTQWVQQLFKHVSVQAQVIGSTQFSVACYRLVTREGMYSLVLMYVCQMLMYSLTFPTQVLSWEKQMVAMSGSGPGYSQTVIITPYMHALIYHVPVLSRRHGSLRLFSGQGKYSCRLTLFIYFFETYQ